VERLESADGKVVQRFEPQVVRKIDIPEAHRRAVVAGLVATVNEAGGTAMRARNMYKEGLEGIEVAGKTGTAQVVRIGSVRLKTHQMDFFTRDHAWFAGFAPADNPEIAIIVLNEHGGHGGVDAAPTGMAVIAKYFELKKKDAAAPSVPRVNQPYTPPAPAAPVAQETLTRGG
jgi:penicillin-binding protein 2